jgi:aspartate kinase
MISEGIVDKYGGTSLATAERDLKALKGTVERFGGGEDYCFLVCSGAGKASGREIKATDLAYQTIEGNERAWDQLTKQCYNNLRGHQLDGIVIDDIIREGNDIVRKGNFNGENAAKIIGMPERVKARILYQVGKKYYSDIEFEILDYNQNGMVGKDVDENTDVPIDHHTTLANIAQLAREKDLRGKIIIVPGFIGTKEKTGEMITLERGMSDGTATYLGAALYLNEVNIWSDYNGISPVNPAIIPGLDPIKELTCREAEAFAGLGAKIINDVALKPVRERGTPVRILNSFNPEQQGTIIRASSSTDHYGVKAIANVSGYTLITVYDMRMNERGVAGKVANIFANSGISIESEVDGDSNRTYAIFPNGNIGKLLMELDKEKHRVETINQFARISLVGEGMDLIEGRTAEDVFLSTIKALSIQSRMYSRANRSVIRSAFIPENFSHQLITYLFEELGFANNGKSKQSF